MFLQLDDGSTVLAVLGPQRHDSLAVEVLDDLPGSEPDDVSVEGLLLVDDSGLHRWSATGTLHPGAASATLTLTSPERVLQRRQHRRFAVDLRATVHRLRQESESRTQDAHVIDLSRGGLRLTAERMEIGDTVRVTFLAGSDPVEVVGRVLLAYPDGQGRTMVHVAFLAPVTAEEPAGTLDDYLDNLAATAPAG